ncbi:MAG TPA: phytanoyl-CoA dioxygenase, partial [Candidatus Latescibacteria bacterium]|nr:phytanoyl-CoA dioxygenase [Candidatus Latescibacterota bacterium]
MSSYLLNDQAMQDFIINGYLVLKPENLTEAFHQDAYNRLTAMIERHGNPGSDLLDRAPYINDVLNAPEVTGALTSLIGANHVLDRHCA